MLDRIVWERHSDSEFENDTLYLPLSIAKRSTALSVRGERRKRGKWRGAGGVGG